MTNHQSPVLQTLRQLKTAGSIRALDYQFARFLQEMGGEPLTVLAGALVSHELASGNVCLSLEDIEQQSLFGIDQEALQSLEPLLVSGNWQEQLSGSRLVSDGSEGSAPTPLVLNRNRLYLYRYWHFEHRVAEILRNKTARDVEPTTIRTILDRLFQRDYALLLDNLKSEPDQRAAVIKWLDIVKPDELDWDTIGQTIQQANSGDDLNNLDKLIPEHACLNWQKVAAALAATQSFSVISGGPGTGKTTTVTRLLAMLVELEQQTKGKAPVIRLVAPTGKAAARLTESIGGALEKLHCSESVRSNIPSEAGTIHRLLGVIPNSTEFRHHRDNPIHLDILVVDEASMVDLPMMNRLLDALPTDARIILLGDRDQLASVDAGSVLGDICAAAGNTYTEKQQEQLQQLTGYDLRTELPETNATIHDCFCLLQKSYRFDASSGIGQLAAAVNGGKVKHTRTVWEAGFHDIRRHLLNDSGYQTMLQLCVEQYRPYLQAIKEGMPARKVLAAFNQFRLLCALREGVYGVEGLNLEIRSTLARHRLIERETLWYPGRPVLITRNDHGLGLYNGDIGITLAGADDRLRVVFQLPDGSLKELLPSRLPAHETVYAMTIHKSQGSEFAHTAMILPDKINPVLTRELVYTGITRAKRMLELFTTDAVFNQSVARQTHRSSGLKERLLA
ncbi:exodeoxyribonuclease V subunit alpha [Endozoicomonas gorgoniicola]|uniref:RecBCD enzyme subunit RecD n=1 Tax=Endozoicomonas gorgoniicola TaxID=1234144 RepID=A0ABT3MSL1_9GAMM|nr:exodeoxyribonuclease V subunit alpha [Endozoicomonas gorgoniicola]MCW7552088.1 exodeoxyribonuclease V subunit alpha [Endozoicomonas gorgoniicola]